MQSNSIVAPYIHLVDRENWSPSAGSGWHIIMGESSPQGLLSRALSLEHYLREMVSRCCLMIIVPDMAHRGRPSSDLKRFMSPTMKKRIVFADRKGSTWDAVRTYCAPIASDFSRHGSGDTTEGDADIDSLAWSLYLLCIGLAKGAEISASPSDVTANISAILACPALTPESRARLANIQGIFSAFSVKTESPRLRFLPDIPASVITDRIAEIVEDAYLLEASALRRLLGLRQNVAAVRRDLRLLLRTITRSRKWAKDIVAVGTEMLATGTDVSKVANAAIQIVPHLATESHVVLCPQSFGPPPRGAMLELMCGVRGGTIAHVYIDEEEPQPSPPAYPVEAADGLHGNAEE